ncbi:Transposase (plasmid) [Nostoc flagelliforme CCNUN1]|uniref:Transposase n=1 Tax=Nostoc flagelliforme CCNUN1 TaxID=2038116 RepID=A0A2K8T7E3_9NOSO|nr:Transposase [Nostoc flagelliforme CCNUN1]
MVSQHLETATLTVEVSQEQSTDTIVLDTITQSAHEEAIAKLQDFIALRPDAREVRKALAVKLVYQGYLYDEIQT